MYCLTKLEGFIVLIAFLVAFPPLISIGLPFLTPPCDSAEAMTISRMKVALEQPVFTIAAYNNSFYVFFEDYSKSQIGDVVTANLSFLNTTFTKAWGQTSVSYKAISDFANSKRCGLAPGRNLFILTDLDIDNGAFLNQSYDIIIFPHSEYVTQKEYSNLQQYVAGGGELILLGGNSLYAEVNYNGNHVWLVQGKGWKYDGDIAIRILEIPRWNDSDYSFLASEYVGYSSCSLEFGAWTYVVSLPPWVPPIFPYLCKSCEINSITNQSNTTILAEWNNSLRIAIYSHLYGQGRVIDFGITTDYSINSYPIRNILYQIIVDPRTVN
jgi:hypothetical protein